MSRLFAAISGLKAEQQSTGIATPPPVPPPDLASAPLDQTTKAEQYWLKVVQPTEPPSAEVSPERMREQETVTDPDPDAAETVESSTIVISASPESRLVAFTDPNSLGAEKFRALATRFDHLRNQRQFRSFQVTSSAINEGKSLVAANIAITLAQYSGSKTLLVEGDLHRPTLENSLGLSGTRGLIHWWSDGAADLGKYVHQVNGMPLWFLPAGGPYDQPSDLLRSARFVKAFGQLAGQFEWTVVDSAPMLPTVDVNLWSRLLDGTLLVVREGKTPVKVLKNGLKALDHPKLVGVVVNDATGFDQVNYKNQYYPSLDRREKLAKFRMNAR
jgi:capsular exopolysaccharide synthesis family protein